MDGTAFDEQTHHNEKNQTGYHHHPPVLLKDAFCNKRMKKKYLNPLGDSFYRPLVEEEILETGQRSIRVDASTLAENVAVTLVVVARTAGMQHEAAVTTTIALDEVGAIWREFG